MDATTQTIAFLIIILAFVSVALGAAVVINARRRARLAGIAEQNIMPLRPIDAYDALPGMIGLAVEADRPLLISTGSSNIGDEQTLFALAALTLAYYTTNEMAIGNTSPVLVTNQSLMIPLASDMLKRAYLTAGQTPRTTLASVRWYGTLQDRSLVFTAMLTATMQADQVTGSVLLGNFGAELGLALGAAQRRNIGTISGSDNIIGQAVAYGMSDHALFGEDIFTPAGYLGNSVSERGGLLAQDFLRGVLIVGILLIALTEVAGEQVGQALAPLFGLFGG
jgi:hypothetical protein